MGVTDPWAEARRSGVLLYESALPPAVRRCLEESRLRVGEAQLPIDLEIADPELAALPWELLRDPDTDRPLALMALTPFNRLAPNVEAAGGKTAPKVGALRVQIIDPALGEEEIAAAQAVGADPRVEVSVAVGSQLTAAPAPHVLQTRNLGEEETTVLAPLVVVDGNAATALAACERPGVRAAVALPSEFFGPARTAFLATLYAGLAGGQPVDRAVVAARRAVAALSAIGPAWALPILVTAGEPEPLVAPRSATVAVAAGKVREHTFGWLRETLSGVVSSLVVFLAGLVFFQLGFSSSAEFELDILSPYSLYTSFKGLVLELSTFREHFLVAAGLLLLLATAVVAYLWLRNREIVPEEHGGWAARLTGPVSSLRSVTFLGVACLTVFGAYAYQQYLWNVLLPIPEGAFGFAITREAAAASFDDELADALFTQGQAQEVVVRELPVRFDARDTDEARALGKRIGARAVLIYRADEGNDGETRYVAYVVFTDPSLGVSVGSQPTKPGDGTTATATQQAAVRFKESIAIPALHTDTLSELVDAAAGIIAYDEDRLREAIEHLELARPTDPGAPNNGIVNFYLGASYELDQQRGRAADALERAATFFERRQATGEQLGPQDELLLVKTYLTRGKVAFQVGDLDGAVAWFEKALGPREDLLARAEGLERPTDVHATYARLYSQLATVHRYKGDAEEESHWKGRASAEIDALAAAMDPDDAQAYVEQSAARFFIGECVLATAAADRALDVDPSEADAYLVAAVVAQLQGREDLAERGWLRVLDLRPDDVQARQALAATLLLQGLRLDSHIEPAYFEEAARQYREILALDPTNLDAHEHLAQLAEWRGEDATHDSTALVQQDTVTYQKSAALWPADPARHQVALAAYTDLIEQRRIIATELRPGSPVARVDLANAYLKRQDLLYWALLHPEIAGDPNRMRAMGARITSDAAHVRTWTDAVIAPASGASRTDRLLAWSAALQALDREWAWYTFPEFAKSVSPWFSSVVGDVRSAQLQAAWQAATREAIAFAEFAEPASTDDAQAMGRIFLEVSLATRFFDGDEAAADALQARGFELLAAQLDERTSLRALDEAFCAEERERRLGDDLMERGAVTGARARYETALKLNPTHVPALNGLGVVLFGQGDIPGAAAKTEAATRAAPEVPLAWANLGRYHLAAGDTAAGDAAYGRYLDLVAVLPSQERMASLMAAIADLRVLLDDRPDLAPRAREIVPAFAQALEAMASSGAEGTYQYPGLYAALGALALYADDAATAEPLLRRAVELDPHLPATRAQLALAVLGQGRDGSTESSAAIAETRDPLWTGIEGADAANLLTNMAEEARRYTERFPGRAEQVRGFADAVTTAREHEAGSDFAKTS